MKKEVTKCYKNETRCKERKEIKREKKYCRKRNRIEKERRRRETNRGMEGEEYSHLVETLLGPWKRRARKNSEVWKKRSDREKVRR